MDPVLKSWMFENWVADQEDRFELAKNTALLLASFWNPEAVKQLTNDAVQFQSSDTDFDASTRWIREQNLRTLGPTQDANNSPRRHRKRQLKD